MSKQLDCVIEGCNATVEGETEEDILEQVEEHAATAHPDLDLDQDTVDTIRSHIRDT